MDFLYIILWALLGIWSLANLSSIFGLVGLLLFLALTLIAVPAAYRGSRPFTSTVPVFFASRWSKNNLLFPTQVAVQPTQVIRHQKKPIGAQEEAINITQIASVKIDTGLLWSNVIIESTGGANPIVCHGHLNADARQMQALIQQYQEDYFRRRHLSPHGSEDDAAPKADETTVTLTLTAPPSQRGQRPTILFSETRHLPPRDEEESLDTVVGRLLRQASHSTIHITRLPLSSTASRAGSNHPDPDAFPPARTAKPQREN